MNVPDHLTDDLLVRAFDDELSDREEILVNAHLPGCEGCRQRYGAVRQLSGRIESVIAAGVPDALPNDRDALVERLEAAHVRPAPLPVGRSALRSFRWIGPIAAAVLLALLFVPRLARLLSENPTTASHYRPSATFEVDGETFIPLPYSNPDLPMSAPHIVEMQVPVASLASAGVMFEPVSNEAMASDRSVLADVLVGLDGQPLGVHVLSVE